MQMAILKCIRPLSIYIVEQNIKLSIILYIHMNIIIDNMSQVTKLRITLMQLPFLKSVISPVYHIQPEFISMYVEVLVSISFRCKAIETYLVENLRAFKYCCILGKFQAISNIKISAMFDKNEYTVLSLTKKRL